MNKRVNYKKYSYYKDGKRYFEQEHRHIMEEYLGRKLNKNEVVHHINGNKIDNRIENLQIMDKREHARMHSSQQIVSEETKQKISKIHKHKISPNRQKTKEDIINIVLKYKELKSYRKVDRFFGFSNRTTRDIICGVNYYNYQDLIKEILNN